MRVLIISDSHGKTDNILQLKKQAANIDLIIHCGDGAGDFDFIGDYMKCRITGVSGNCDLFSREPSVINLDIDGKKIHIEHGHRLPVHRDKDMMEYAKLNGYDAILYGHTHVQKILKDGNTWVVNPGSISRPRDGEPSYLIMETDGKGDLSFKAGRLSW